MSSFLYRSNAVRKAFNQPWLSAETKSSKLTSEPAQPAKTAVINATPKTNFGSKIFNNIKKFFSRGKH